MKNSFGRISITGRYIYGYLCLRNFITAKSFDAIPEILDRILTSFTNCSRLDIWQDGANEVLPSVLLDCENSINRFKVISHEDVLVIKNYYLKNKLTADIIENLLWIGMSNLYGKFNSNISLPYLEDIIDISNKNRLELPAFEIIHFCSVTERNGWGNLVDINEFIVK